MSAISPECRVIKATCLCGNAKHEAILPEAIFPVEGCCCHCTSCRRMTGCMCFTSIGILEEDHYRPQESLFEKLTAFEFSKGRITHYFCSTCGTHMVARVLPKAPKEEDVATWYIACGTIEDLTNVFQPRHDYISDTVDGGIADFVNVVNNKQIERWGGHPGDGEQLASPFVAANQPQEKSNNRLHAYCKCHGVSFWIGRPDDGIKFEVELCTCRSCRLSNGMEWFAGASACMEPKFISLDELGHLPFESNHNFGTLKWYNSSSDTSRSFCGVCGATVFSTNIQTNTVKVAVGLLDAAEGSRAESWLEWPFAKLRCSQNNLPRNEN